MSIGHDMLALRRIVAHNCAICGKEFHGLVTGKYCSNACKMKAKRARAKQQPEDKTMATIDQDKFHPFLGHVAEGNRIRTNCGDVLEILATMRGWKLLGPKGLVIETPDATELTTAVVSYTGE